MLPSEDIYPLASFPRKSPPMAIWQRRRTKAQIAVANLMVDGQILGSFPNPNPNLNSNLMLPLLSVHPCCTLYCHRCRRRCSAPHSTPCCILFYFCLEIVIWECWRTKAQIAVAKLMVDGQILRSFPKPKYQSQFKFFFDAAATVCPSMLHTILLSLLPPLL